METIIQNISTLVTATTRLCLLLCSLCFISCQSDIGGTETGNPETGSTASDEEGDADTAGADDTETTDDTALCDDNDIPSYAYMMAFHSCASDCSSPINHRVRIAGSDDGENWEMIDAFSTYEGSVPEIVYFNAYLYLFTPGTMRQYNACLEEVASASVTLTSDTDSGSFVDPSLIVDGDDLHLFYLPGIIGEDPAGCSAYPCTKEIHSATPDDETLSAFTQTDGVRASLSLDSGVFSDPEIIAAPAGGYMLYVSSGQSVLGFTATSLSDEFTSPDGNTDRVVVNGNGGVPSAIVTSDNTVRIYVTTSSGGVETIRMAESADGMTQISSAAFSTVVDSSSAEDFSPTTYVSSPSVIDWPDENWSRVVEE